VKWVGLFVGATPVGLGALVYWQQFVYKGPSGFGYRTGSEEAVVDAGIIRGKNILITGANTGVGKETARVMAKFGAANVFMGCRDMKKCEAAAQEIRTSTKNYNVHPFQLDLASLKGIERSVIQLNQNFHDPPLHTVINNAGVLDPKFGTTEDGFENHFGINHVGHFHLTNLLLPNLKSGAPSRVVVVASDAYKAVPKLDFDALKRKDTWFPGTFGSFKSYGLSKTSQMLFTHALNSRLQQDSIGSAYSATPGLVDTNIQLKLREYWIGQLTHVLGLMGMYKTLSQGASTIVYAATVPDPEKKLAGKYFCDCNTPEVTLDWNQAEMLWQVTEDLISEANK